MSDHQLRHPELDPARGIRDAIRSRLPDGKAGLVAEDLDLVIRTFGPNYQLDAAGRFALIEVKHGNVPNLGESKERTFGLIDWLLRLGDPNSKWYRGFYTLRHKIHPEAEWQPNDVVKLNSTELTVSQFMHWVEHDECDGQQIKPRQKWAGRQPDSEPHCPTCTCGSDIPHTPGEP